MPTARGCFGRLPASKLAGYFQPSLFPFIAGMEAAKAGRGPVARAPFGSVQNPVAMNAATNGYSAPDDGCVSYQTLYKALAGFEADLHQHIHLESNILFPRAVALEEGEYTPHERELVHSGD